MYGDSRLSHEHWRALIAVSLGLGLLLSLMALRVDATLAAENSAL